MKSTAIVCGAGLVWTAIWYWWFRDEPSEHPEVNAAENALIVAGRGAGVNHHEGGAYWRRLFAHRNTLPLCLAYIPNSCAFYFCITWLPTFLKEKHHFDASALGFFSGCSSETTSPAPPPTAAGPPPAPTKSATGAANQGSSAAQDSALGGTPPK